MINNKYDMFSNTITIIMQEMGVVIGYPVLRTFSNIIIY